MHILIDHNGKFFHSDIQFLISNDSIKMNDIILGTKWLREHHASLNLNKVSTLDLKLKDRYGKWGKRQLSLEPEKGTFLLNNDEENVSYLVYTTSLLFNNETSGQLMFQNNVISPIEFSFDILNVVDWENGKPYMDNVHWTF